MIDMLAPMILGDVGALMPKITIRIVLVLANGRLAAPRERMNFQPKKKVSTTLKIE